MSEFKGASQTAEPSWHMKHPDLVTIPTGMVFLMGLLHATGMWEHVRSVCSMSVAISLVGLSGALIGYLLGRYCRNQLSHSDS